VRIVLVIYVAGPHNINIGTHKENTMKSIYKFLENLFKPVTHQNKLEEYIVSHNPQSVNDVEKLTRDYDRKMKQTIGTLDSSGPRSWPL